MTEAPSFYQLCDRLNAGERVPHVLHDAGPFFDEERCSGWLVHLDVLEEQGVGALEAMVDAPYVDEVLVYYAFTAAQRGCYRRLMKAVDAVKIARAWRTLDALFRSLLSEGFVGVDAMSSDRIASRSKSRECELFATTRLDAWSCRQWPKPKTGKETYASTTRVIVNGGPVAPGGARKTTAPNGIVVPAAGPIARMTSKRERVSTYSFNPKNHTTDELCLDFNGYVQSFDRDTQYPMSERAYIQPSHRDYVADALARASDETGLIVGSDWLRLRIGTHGHNHAWRVVSPDSVNVRGAFPKMSNVDRLLYLRRAARASGKSYACAVRGFLF